MKVVRSLLQVNGRDEPMRKCDDDPDRHIPGRHIECGRDCA